MDVYYQQKIAVPCALIINELITNAVKHLFPDGQSGIIQVVFTNKNGNYLLQGKDTGMGAPEKILEWDSDSLGMELVQALTGQIRGKLEVSNERGATFRITFPSASK